MALTSREGFASWYAAFTMAHTVLDVDLSDTSEEFQQMYNSVIDTVWQSKYPDLTQEDIEELKDDLNIEMMSIQTILEEAVKSNKMGEEFEIHYSRINNVIGNICSSME